MRVSKRLVLVSAALASMLAAPASMAVEITPLSQTRNALTGFGTDYVATDFGLFDVPGRHVSSIGSQSLSASLAAAGGSAVDPPDPEPFGYGESSTFLLDFEIDEDASFSLTGSLDVTSNDLDGWTNGAASITLRSYNPTTMLYSTIFEQVASTQLELWPIHYDFDQSGLLPAGQYQIDLQSGGQGFEHSENGFFWTDSEAQLSFELTEIPEPGTGALLGGALSLLALRRRLGRRS